MKLLFITPYYKPAWYFGGPPKCISEQAEHLHHAFKWDIDVITLNLNGASRLFEQDGIVNKDVEGINVMYLPHRQTPFYNYYYSDKLRDFQSTFALYDVIHIHGVFNAFSKAGMQMALKAKVPFIVTPHGMLDKWSLQKSRGVKWLHHYFFESRLLVKAAAIHVTTEAEKLNSNLPDGVKTSVIPYLIQFKNTKISQQQKLNMTGKVGMIFFGRINRKKGILQFIEAISKLSDADKQKLVFDIYGNDEENHLQAVKRSIVKYQLQNVISYKGFLLPQERNRILKLYDIMVLTSFQENFGITVLESLEENVPVFISEEVNVYEWIKKYDCGWVTAMNPESIAIKLREILMLSPAQISIKGHNAQELFRKELDINIVIQEYKKLYEDVVD